MGFTVSGSKIAVHTAVEVEKDSLGKEASPSSESSDDNDEESSTLKPEH
jgi:hypothetical protein